MDIEKLEEYPIFESTSAYYFNKLNGLYNTRKHSGRKHEYKYKCKELAQRILYSNIGKSFDLAFSYYCSKVPKWCQKFFLEEVEPSWRYQQFFVEDDIITHKKTRYSRGFKRKVPVVYYSEDYQTEWYDVRTKETLKNRWYSAVPDKFIAIRVVSGWSKEFESRHDKEFRRLMLEKNKRRKKANKINKRETNLSNIEKAKILLRLHNKRNNKEFKFTTASFNEYYKDYIDPGSYHPGCYFIHYEILKYIADKFNYFIFKHPDFKFKTLRYWFNSRNDIWFESNLPENVSKEFTKNLSGFLYRFHIENPFEKE